MKKNGLCLLDKIGIFLIIMSCAIATSITNDIIKQEKVEMVVTSDTKLANIKISNYTINIDDSIYDSTNSVIKLSDIGLIGEDIYDKITTNTGTELFETENGATTMIDINFKDNNENTLTKYDFLGTGYKITLGPAEETRNFLENAGISISDITKTIYVVIKGDLTKDGITSNEDLNKSLLAKKNLTTLDTYEKIAIDFNENGSIDLADLYQQAKLTTAYNSGEYINNYFKIVLEKITSDSNKVKIAIGTHASNDTELKNMPISYYYANTNGITDSSNDNYKYYMEPGIFVKDSLRFSIIKNDNAYNYDSIQYSTNNSAIATMSSNVISFVEGKTGDVIITASSNCNNKTTESSIKINSTTSIRTVGTSVNEKWHNKQVLGNGEYYSVSELNKVENILKQRVEQAGYGTRAGVVAAARFLVGELNERIPYYYHDYASDGKSLDDTSIDRGTYYKEGLNIRTASTSSNCSSGDQYWGCEVKKTSCNYDSCSMLVNGENTRVCNTNNIGYQEKYQTISESNEKKYGFCQGETYNNGLDCTGFLSWTFLNGGVDPTLSGNEKNNLTGDILFDYFVNKGKCCNQYNTYNRTYINYQYWENRCYNEGTGTYSQSDSICYKYNIYSGYNLNQLLEDKTLYLSYIKSKLNEVKAGDLFSSSSHIGIIIGIDDTYFYLAEATGSTQCDTINSSSGSNDVDTFSCQRPGLILTKILKSDILNGGYGIRVGEDDNSVGNGKDEDRIDARQFTEIRSMEGVYPAEGNYTSMW